MPISRSVHLCLHPVAWLVVLLVYMLIGGGIFQAIESDEKRYEWSYVDSCMFAMSVFTTTGKSLGDAGISLISVSSIAILHVCD